MDDQNVTPPTDNRETGWSWRVLALTPQGEYVRAFYGLRAEIEGRVLEWDPETGSLTLGKARERPGAHRPDSELASFLRRSAEFAPVVAETGDEAWVPVPRRMLLYLAGRLDGSIRLPRGPQSDPSAAVRALHDDLEALWRVRRRQGVYRRFRTGRDPSDRNCRPDVLKQMKSGTWKVLDPKGRALKRVAKAFGRTAAALSERLKLAAQRNYDPILKYALEPVESCSAGPSPDPGPRPFHLMVDMLADNGCFEDDAPERLQPAVRRVLVASIILYARRRPL